MSVSELSDYIIQKMNEETTMSDIIYLPSSLGAVKTAFKSLAKEKPDWNIEILENEDGKIVNFENKLRILVSSKDWSAFGKFMGELNTSSVSLKNFLKIDEAKNNLFNLRNELKTELNRYFELKLFLITHKLYSYISSNFGISKYFERNILIPCFDKKKAIKKLYGDFIRRYGDDKGMLEVIIDSIKHNESLARFEIKTEDNKVFALSSNYDFLYGFRVLSRLYKFSMIFEFTVDFSLFVQQSISIFGEDRLLDFVGDNVAGVSIVRDVIYPKAGIFTTHILSELMKALKDFSDNDDYEDK
jgi:hypothetical protein